MTTKTKLLRTKNKVKNTVLLLNNLGYKQVVDENSGYFAADTLLVDVTNQTYTVLDSHGFIAAAESGVLNNYKQYDSADSLLRYVKRNLPKKKKTAEQTSDGEPVTTETSENVTETKTPETND